LPSELEETALRWRTARLADLGFPGLEEALSWYARPPTSPASPAGKPGRPPGFFLAAFSRGSLLDRGLEGLEATERPAVEAQLVSAANAVLVADQVDPADPEMVRGAFEAARALLELGLEARLRASGKPLDGAGAAEVLASMQVKRLFQEGFGQLLALRWRAERLLSAGGAGSRSQPLFDPPLGEALVALSARRPRYFPGLEAPREEWGTAAAGAHAARAFLSSAELARTATALDLCEGLAALARSLGLGSPPNADPASRLTAWYLTALAQERLGRPFAPVPLDPAELPRAVRALEEIDDPRLTASGEAGALLLAMARARAVDLRRLDDAGELTPERVVDLVVRS
jgi:hypothetical protein